MQTDTIELNTLSGHRSRIVFGDADPILARLLPSERVVVITDSNAGPLYEHMMGDVQKIVLPAGEQTKTPETVNAIHRSLVEQGAGRDTFLLGVGGGVVTDITGYAASTYMRGIRFGFVATTLLSQVDAAIGGKNGVNLDGYKNMVGTFAQPEFVVCDMSMLDTLPDREFRSGLAEIIKAGIIADPQLFALLEHGGAERLKDDPGLLQEAIIRAIKVKISVVEQDERESGVRKLLNLGHTFGHAIERLSDKYTHGEAVAIGMCMASDISVKLGLMLPADAVRIRNMIRGAGLPVTAPVDPRQMCRAILNDKKCTWGGVNIILPVRVGECKIHYTTFGQLESLLATIVPAS